MTVGIFYKPKRTRNPNLFLAYSYTDWSRTIAHRGYGGWPIITRAMTDPEREWLTDQDRCQGFYYTSWDQLIEDEQAQGVEPTYLEQLAKISRRYYCTPDKPAKRPAGQLDIFSHKGHVPLTSRS